MEIRTQVGDIHEETAINKGKFKKNHHSLYSKQSQHLLCLVCYWRKGLEVFSAGSLSMRVSGLKPLPPKVD
jgi:hypothetical protein